MIPPSAAGGARKQGAYVYLLRSHVDGSHYLGWTTDVVRRLVEHNTEALVGLSRRTRPWQLVGIERVASVQAAKARERTLKRNARMFQLFKKRMLNQAAARGLRQVGG